jgi:signal transduction histidine kinase/PAS domain-containing protein
LPEPGAFLDFVIDLPQSRHPLVGSTAGPIAGTSASVPQDGIGALVVVVDARGGVVTWNRECEIVTGRAASEVAGDSAASVLFGGIEEADPGLTRFFTAGSDPGSPSRVLRSIRTRGGQRRQVLWERRCIWDERGREQCVLTGMHFVDPRCENNERRQAFLAHAGQALASSLDFPETLRTVVRLAIKELADACVLELGEEDGCFRVHADHRDLSKRPLMRRLCDRGSGRAGRILSFPSVRAEDSVLWSDVRTDELRGVIQDDDDAKTLSCLCLRSLLVIPICARGRPMGTLTLISEHPEECFEESDLRLAEDFAREAAFAIDNALLYQRAQEAILTRDQVLEMVAHDLRNPLGEIVLAVDLLESNDPRAARTAARVRRSTERMQRMIRDLLDAKEIEHGSLLLERRTVAPGDLVLEACESARERALQRGIELRVCVPPDLPPVDVDPDRILQVLGNLLDNALKFTPPGGRIDVIGRAHSRSIGLRIVDTGPGIPVDELERVFDRFSHRSRSRGGGNGLGLAISKAIIEAHEGRILVSNVEPHGAAFRVTLPIAGPTEQGF